MQNLTIDRAKASDITRLRAMAEQMSRIRDSDYFERNLECQEKGEREVLLAMAQGADAGYCVLNWKPKYAFFKKLNIPEIQDLNVLNVFRRRGIATAMIALCERRAVEKGFEEIGIGVGLDSSFGSAQKLYTRLGYIPDGNGITYDRKLVAAGEFRPVDEHLCLMMVKTLRK